MLWLLGVIGGVGVGGTMRGKWRDGGVLGVWGGRLGRGGGGGRGEGWGECVGCGQEKKNKKIMK